MKSSELYTQSEINRGNAFFKQKQAINVWQHKMDA